MRTINGISMRIDARNGVVTWCEDWSTLVQWACNDQHGFTTKSYGPETYGHTEIILTEVQ